MLATVKPKQLIDAVVLGVPIMTVLALVNEWNAKQNWAGQRDHWRIFWAAASTYGLDFWLGRVSVLGKGSFGSAAMLHYVIYLFPAILLVYVLRGYYRFHTGKECHAYLWTNLRWVVWTFVWSFIATGIAAYAHYADLYTIRIPEYGIEIEGRVDDLTHLFTPGMISASALMINCMALFRWRGRLGRVKEAIFLTGIVSIILWYWEVAEIGLAYANPPWNSLSDLFFGYLAHFFNLAWYNVVVPFEDE